MGKGEGWRGVKACGKACNVKTIKYVKCKCAQGRQRRGEQEEGELGVRILLTAQTEAK